MKAHRPGELAGRFLLRDAGIFLARLQRLGVETQRLAAAERQLNDAERALADLANTATEVQHVIGALRDFSVVWEAMTTSNRGRLLRALLDRVVVEETSGRVDIHLVDFAADPEAPATTSATSKEEAAA